MITNTSTTSPGVPTSSANIILLFEISNLQSIGVVFSTPFKKTLISFTSRLPEGCWNVSTANSFCPVCGITNSTLYPAFKIVLFTFTIKLCSVGIE